VDQEREHDGPAVVLLGHERHRRREHDVEDRRQLLRRGLGLGDGRNDDVGGRRQHQHPADDLVELVQPEPEPGRDPKVPAATAERPKEIGVVLGVHPQDAAVGRDQVGRDQVVDRQAVLAGEVPDADPPA
jgi:hypothetical protein